jgi:hypothetical protein
MNPFSTSAVVAAVRQDALRNVVGYCRTDAEMIMSMRAV